MSDNVRTLIDRLKQYDIEYHTDGESSISDKEYDALRRKAQLLDPGNSYFTSVGSDVRGGKEKLPYSMGSLDQVYDQNEWSNWVVTYSLCGKYVIISHKQDGISAMLIYRHGKFEKAYSRGNGMEGADISRHVRRVPSVPKDLSGKIGDAYLAVRAELIMPIATFNTKYAGTFRNPRNMVAGCFNRTQTDDAILADIQCITYQVVAYSGIENTDGTPFKIQSKEEELKLLAELGFIVTPYQKVKADDVNEAVLKKQVAAAKSASKTELDGVVVTINRYDDLDPQRRSTTTLNPEHSIKYKVSADAVLTEVVDVIWEISKSGYYKPRVEIKPVDLVGVTITYATGFHGKFINENGIGPGAKVMITRAGDVIPYITEVVKKVTPKMPSDVYDWNDTGTECIVVGDDNAEVKFKQVLSFMTSLNVELLKESSLSEAIDRMKLGTYSIEAILWTLFDLSDVEWVKLIGANGSKIYTSLQRRLHNLSYPLFLGSTHHLGIGIGVRKMTALLSQMTIDELSVATVDDIAKLDGFDIKTATQIHAGLPAAMEFMDRLLKADLITIVQQTKTAELKGINVVFTGFRDADLHETIEKMGGKVGSSVSSKTTHLLTTDPKSNSGKAKKARDLGITVMDPEEFKDHFNL